MKNTYVASGMYARAIKIIIIDFLNKNNKKLTSSTFNRSYDLEVLVGLLWEFQKNSLGEVENTLFFKIGGGYGF